jgi:hypothetical protein
VGKLTFRRAGTDSQSGMITSFRRWTAVDDGIDDGVRGFLRAEHLRALGRLG